MRTVAQIRKDENIPLVQKKDSLYKVCLLISIKSKQNEMDVMSDEW